MISLCMQAGVPAGFALYVRRAPADCAASAEPAPDDFALYAGRAPAGFALYGAAAASFGVCASLWGRHQTILRCTRPCLAADLPLCIVGRSCRIVCHRWSSAPEALRQPACLPAWPFGARLLVVSVSFVDVLCGRVHLCAGLAPARLALVLTRRLQHPGPVCAQNPGRFLRVDFSGESGACQTHHATERADFASREQCTLSQSSRPKVNEPMDHRTRRSAG